MRTPDRFDLMSSYHSLMKSFNAPPVTGPSFRKLPKSMAGGLIETTGRDPRLARILDVVFKNVKILHIVSSYKETDLSYENDDY